MDADEYIAQCTHPMNRLAAQIAINTRNRNRGAAAKDATMPACIQKHFYDNPLNPGTDLQLYVSGGADALELQQLLPRPANAKERTE